MNDEKSFTQAVSGASHFLLLDVYTERETGELGHIIDDVRTEMANALKVL